SDATDELYGLGFQNYHTHVKGEGDVDCVIDTEPNGGGKYPHSQRIDLTVERFDSNSGSPPQECIDNPDD
ncbi:MAG TPA: hypothetical protein VE172_14690, partial [Stackebrandtia sp.]|uniref:hypothetical protein n=1 Tax=Stackebrandtia sp. TaxID=2023065 RepID=UPI002D4672A0